MIKEVFDIFGKEYSGERAKQVVSQIVNFHRIQASPGYRAAADCVKSLMSEAGLDSEILVFPAKERISFWNHSSFQESDINDAKLFLITKDGEEKVADYSDSKFSVIQRSISTPLKGIESDLVVLEKGETEDEYKKNKVKGKVVFTSGDVGRVYSLAVDKFGAVGILSDRLMEWPPVREKIDLPDGLQYTSFWWYPKNKKCFGFVVSPRVGMKIRALAKTEPLKVKAYVRSNLYDGTFEVVSAKIPGETDEEILMTAHLCHPQPSANDNSSGVGVVVEAARVMSKLIKDGKLRKPKSRG
jgi:aminopeptidase YwaD